jgi:hypothetical protein
VRKRKKREFRLEIREERKDGRSRHTKHIFVLFFVLIYSPLYDYNEIT